MGTVAKETVLGMIRSTKSKMVAILRSLFEFVSDLYNAVYLHEVHFKSIVKYNVLLTENSDLDH